MAKEYGYNSYCPLFGNHDGDPCSCGWSTKNDMSELAEDLMHYYKIYRKETGNEKPLLGEFLAWVLIKAWD